MGLSCDPNSDSDLLDKLNAQYQSVLPIVFAFTKMIHLLHTIFTLKICNQRGKKPFSAHKGGWLEPIKVEIAC